MYKYPVSEEITLGLLYVALLSLMGHPFPNFRPEAEQTRRRIRPDSSMCFRTMARVSSNYSRQPILRITNDGSLGGG